MAIAHYPQGNGERDFRKAQTRVQRRADDRLIAYGIEHVSSEPAKKARRRWCRGKVGVEHQPHWYEWLHFECGIQGPGGWWRQECAVCGKKLDLEFRRD